MEQSVLSIGFFVTSLGELRQAHSKTRCFSELG